MQYDGMEARSSQHRFDSPTSGEKGQVPSFIIHLDATTTVLREGNREVFPSLLFLKLQRFPE
ncbi:hypothetical protein KSD_53800 [Ktedonobacter sp. SOSP1-85]|nr:hypothetical protein KSD_53800 [Ktedonobacter sp. SOSP1-85]